MRPLRVAVDARLHPGTVGGVESVVVGLAQGFSELSPSDLDVVFVTHQGDSSWLVDQAPRARYLEVPLPSTKEVVARKVRGAIRRGGGALHLAVPPRIGLLPDPAMERIGPDLVHYPFQARTAPSLPFIYQPHDLQHLHLPQFFSARSVASREYFYPAMCNAAAAVAVGTRWVKDDLLRSYRLPEDKVHVIALAPPVDPGATAGPRPPGLPENYLFYPAANWPHKNHVGLMSALALARSRGVEIELVLTGPVFGAYDDPAQLATAAGVQEHVHSLGYVDAATLGAVYAGARGVVVPTLFEAASFPIWEAFSQGLPVACSNVTSLPDQTAGQALIFDPHDTAAMADSMVALWTDEALRERLASGGRERAAQFTWRATAEGFAALYRKVGGVPLLPGDAGRLAAEEL